MMFFGSSRRGGVVAVGGASPTFDPTTLALTGLFRDYAGLTWAGVDSAGTSGSHDLATAVGAPDNAPVVGTALNGHGVANFAGTESAKEAAVSMEAYVSATAYTIAALIKPTNLQAPAANIYDDQSIFTESGGAIGLVVNTNGITIYHYQGSYKTATVAIAADTWSLVVATYDGVTDVLSISVNGGAPVTTGSTGDLASFVGAQVRLGRNYGTVKWTGDLAELLVSDTVIASGDLTSYRTGYINPRYALSL
jgi:hypothetical protein